MTPDDTPTLILGNGPAGLTLSAFLAGWRPCYRGPHPDPEWARRLDGVASLFAAGLPTRARGAPGRGHRPLANLFDAVHHPQADSGRVFPSCLDLRRTAPPVPHRVVGSGFPGGSWHRMPPGMRTLSPGFWMDLPGVSRFDLERGRGRWIDPALRCGRGEIAGYFADYAHHMGLDPYLENGVTVTAAHPDGAQWHVTGHTADGAVRTWNARALVLAVGMYDVPRRLDIPGEDGPRVTHRAPSGETDMVNGPLLVVGAGLSAADVILAARDAGRAVFHAFVDPSGEGILPRLDGAVYPEYRDLYRAMWEGNGDPSYTPLAGTRLTAVDADGTCHLTGPNGAVTHPVAQVAVLIGSDPDLAFLPADLARGLAAGEVSIDPDTFRIMLPSTAPIPPLYAIGPLAGDNFVRFITGHALGAAREILGPPEVGKPVY